MREMVIVITLSVCSVIHQAFSKMANF